MADIKSYEEIVYYFKKCSLSNRQTEGGKGDCCFHDVGIVEEGQSFQ